MEKRRIVGVRLRTALGLLVASTLAVTVGLSVYHPERGGAADGAPVCTDANPGDTGCSGDTGHNAGPAGDDAGHNAGPAYVTAGTLGLPDAGDGCAEVGRQLGQLLPGGSWTFGNLNALSATYGLPAALGADTGLSGRWRLDGCTLVLDLPGDLQNLDEVRTDVNWRSVAATIGAVATGFAAAALANITCTAVGVSAPVILPVCPYLTGFFGGFFTALTATAYSGGTVDETTVLNSILFGLGGAAGGTFPLWAEPFGQRLPGLLRAVADAVMAFTRATWQWISQLIGASAEWLAGFLARAAQFFADHPLQSYHP